MAQPQALSEPCQFYSLLRLLRRKEWIVYGKPPFGGLDHVLRYLARYANAGLLSLIDGQVRFRWRDSKHNNRIKVKNLLDAVKFIHRFLLHILRAGFVKIRHFGFLANRNRRETLALCRLHLRATTSVPTTLLRATAAVPAASTLPTMQTGHLARYRPARGARAPHMDNSSCRLSNQLVLNSIMLTRRLIRIYTAADIPSVSAVVCPHAAFNAHTETASAAYCKSPYPHYPARATLPPANFYRGALSIRHYGFIASYK